MTHIDEKIDVWFYDRGIAQNATELSQATKMLEEVTEVFDAISTGNREDFADALGDVYVTLRGLALVSDMPLDYCIEQAYDEIKNRKGYLREDGTFIKQLELDI